MCNPIGGGKVMLAMHGDVLAVSQTCYQQECIDKEVQRLKEETDLADEEILKILREIFMQQ